MTTSFSEFEDKIVRNQIWKGSVPVQFELSEDDQNVQGISFPFYVRTNTLLLNTFALCKIFIV